jgi:hypothetical protein
VPIMPRRRRREAWVTLEASGHARGGPGVEGPVTAGAIALGQPGEEARRVPRGPVADRPRGRPRVFPACVTGGAAVADDWRQVYPLCRWAGVHGVTSHPEVPRPCARVVGHGGGREGGLDGLFGRRGRRADQALGSLPSLGAPRLLQALAGRGKPSEVLVLLQTRGTPGVIASPPPARRLVVRHGAVATQGGLPRAPRARKPAAPEARRRQGQSTPGAPQGQGRRGPAPAHTPGGSVEDCASRGQAAPEAAPPRNAPRCDPGPPITEGLRPR